jgi:hypothetical protein
MDRRVQKCVRTRGLLPHFAMGTASALTVPAEEVDDVEAKDLTAKQLVQLATRKVGNNAARSFSSLHVDGQRLNHKSNSSVPVDGDI